jgi:hypothetical protein
MVNRTRILKRSAFDPLLTIKVLTGIPKPVVQAIDTRAFGSTTRIRFFAPPSAVYQQKLWLASRTANQPCAVGRITMLPISTSGG